MISVIGTQSRQIVEKWLDEFKRGRTNTVDTERSGRSKEVVTSENIKHVNKIVVETVKRSCRRYLTP